MGLEEKVDRKKKKKKTDIYIYKAHDGFRWCTHEHCRRGDNDCSSCFLKHEAVQKDVALFSMLSPKTAPSRGAHNTFNSYQHVPPAVASHHTSCAYAEFMRETWSPFCVYTYGGMANKKAMRVMTPLFCMCSGFGNCMKHEAQCCQSQQPSVHP